MFWLVVVFCRFKVKDGVVLLTPGLLPPFAWGLLGAAAGPLLAGTEAADLTLSDPVFLARGLR